LLCRLNAPVRELTFTDHGVPAVDVLVCGAVVDILTVLAGVLTVLAGVLREVSEPVVVVVEIGQRPNLT